MLNANRSGLNKFRLVNEKIYKNEAIVDYDFIITPSSIVHYRANLVYDSQSWKLFYIENLETRKSLSFMKETYFAQKRPSCSKEELERLNNADLWK